LARQLEGGAPLRHDERQAGAVLVGAEVAVTVTPVRYKRG